MDVYDRVLESDGNGHFFEETDMVKLMDHQTKFFTMVLGGPARFSDKWLAVARKHMRLSHAQCDEAVTLLGDTLEDASFNRPPNSDEDQHLGQTGNGGQIRQPQVSFAAIS